MKYHQEKNEKATESVRKWRNKRKLEDEAKDMFLMVMIRSLTIQNDFFTGRDDIIGSSRSKETPPFQSNRSSAENFQ